MEKMNIPMPVWSRKAYELLCKEYPQFSNAEKEGRLIVDGFNPLLIENQFEYAELPENNLKKQIDKRCPCFSMALEDCPCLNESQEMEEKLIYCHDCKRQIPYYSFVSNPCSSSFDEICCCYCESTAIQIED